MLHECNSNVFTYLHDEKSCIEIIHSIKDKIYIYKPYFQLLLADYILSIRIVVKQSALIYSFANASWEE